MNVSYLLSKILIKLKLPELSKSDSELQQQQQIPINYQKQIPYQQSYPQSINYPYYRQKMDQSTIHNYQIPEKLFEPAEKNAYPF